MFDFGLGTSELLVIAMVALIVVGPKELPTLLRAIGRMVGKVKALAAEFQSHLDDLTRESGVDDVKKKVEEQMEELTIEDLDREFDAIEREMREQLASGAKPLSEAQEADDEDLTDESERPLPKTLDLDAEPGKDAKASSADAEASSTSDDVAPGKDVAPEKEARDNAPRNTREAEQPRAAAVSE